MEQFQWHRKCATQPYMHFAVPIWMQFLSKWKITRERERKREKVAPIHWWELHNAQCTRASGKSFLCFYAFVRRFLPVNVEHTSESWKGKTFESRIPLRHTQRSADSTHTHTHVCPCPVTAQPIDLCALASAMRHRFMDIIFLEQNRKLNFQTVINTISIVLRIFFIGIALTPAMATGNRWKVLPSQCDRRHRWCDSNCTINSESECGVSCTKWFQIKIATCSNWRKLCQSAIAVTTCQITII